MSFSSDESLSSSYSDDNDEEEIGWFFSPSSEYDDESQTAEQVWQDCNRPSSISIDQATYEAWSIAKYEIALSRNNLSHVLKINTLQDYSLQLLIDYFFEKMWVEVNSILNDGGCHTEKPIEKNSFFKILVTFFMMSHFNKSTTGFFDSDFINKNGLASKNENFEFWNAIKQRDGGKFDESMTYTWQRIMDHTNSICRDLIK